MCTPACTTGLTCCGTSCVNENNDINNCGACGTVCGGAHPYCGDGQCGTAPCLGSTCASAELCCGTQCCGAGELCCNVPGPVTQGPTCTAPQNGTCPVGCALCQ